MAKRYRYAFAKKKESVKGKLSVILAAVSVLLFGVSVFTAAFWLQEKYGFIIGGVCLFAALLSVYGFFMGLTGFSEENCVHRTCIVGSIVNGIIMVFWLSFFLMGV